ncbi:MAG: FG-GAP-like repeat-containing protein [Candidatus Latescibacterota bacterium]
MLREAALAAAGVVVLTISPALAGPMTVLSGEVHDAASGTPLPGANLTVGELATVCDEAGRFHLAVPAGILEVTVTMIGYGQLRRRLTIPSTGLDAVILELETVVLPMSETLIVKRASRAPLFTEVGEAAGLRFRHDFGGQRVANILQTTGAGACFFDADGDGRQDLYLVNGASINALYVSDGDGGFLDATSGAGVGHAGYGMGCAAADYDADGDHDLYVTNHGPNALFRNDGGTPAFREVAAAAGVDDHRWSVGAAWFDLDSDGDLDLYVGNYLDFDPDAPTVRSMASLHEGFRAYPGPRDYLGQPDVLYANRGDGTFVDVSDEVGLNPRIGKAMGCALGDYDDDGDMDLFVANDRTPNHLYRNDGGHLAEVGLEAGVAFDEAGQASGAMGADFADYDGDGRLDLVVSNFSFEYNSLYRNRGDGSFSDATAAAGLAAPSYRYVGWGSLFFDYDNDGDPDLFVANGDVHEDMDLFSRSVTFAQPDQLFRNQSDGTFVDVSASAGLHTTGPAVGRGAAAADTDDDGDLDLLVVNVGYRPHLWRNDGGNNDHWLSLHLVGVEDHPDAIGARVTVRAGALVISRQSHAAYSYMSQGDERLHFGLGGHTEVDSVTIRWPGGGIEILHGLPVDRHLSVTQGQGVAVPRLAAGNAPAAGVIAR